jgi:hypothetical protein
VAEYRVTPPQKFPSAKIRWKYSPLDFLYQDGILPSGYLPKGHTINAEYYPSLLVQLNDILKEKRRGKVTKAVLSLHDNVPAHWPTWASSVLITHPILWIWPRRTTTCSLD